MLRRTRGKATFAGSWALRIVFVIHLVLGVGSPLFAQALRSSVEGRVTDQSGAVISGADVTLTNLRTGETSVTVTNEAGRYIFPSVPVARYSLQVTLPGFATFEESNFVVSVSQRVTIDATLAPGDVTETVTVEAGGLTQALETRSNELGTLIDSRRVQELPLNGRNVLQLGLLSGATLPTGPDQQGHPGRTISVSGLPPRISTIKVNGMVVTGSRLGHLGLNLSPGAVDQFKVRQGFLEGGEGAGAAVVNVVSKSGTNSFHGELFEFHRNDNLDARNFFNPDDEPGEFLRNQFGFSVGGPIMRNRLFAFGNLELLRERRAASANAFTPTAAMFEGDFSELETPIFNPFSFDPNTGQREPFPNNIIPEDMINPVSRNLLAFYRAGSSLSEQPSNLFGNPNVERDSDQFSVRVDYVINPRHTFFGQVSHEEASLTQPTLFPLAGEDRPLNGQLAMIGVTSTFGRRWVNELRGGWTRDSTFLSGETEPGIQEELGVTGTGDPNGVPLIGIDGFDNFGNARGLLGNVDNFYQVHDTVSYSRGNHQVKFGFDLLYARSIEQNANANARGNLSFQSVFTAQLARDAEGRFAPVPNTGSGFADFLLGIPTIGQVRSQPRLHYRWTTIEAFISDSWKITPTLTFNYGISYFLQTPPSPSGDDKMFPHAFDFETGRVLFAALDEIDPKVFDTDTNNVAPQIGLAWRLTDNDVIRAGFTINYLNRQAIDTAQFSIVAPGVTNSIAIANPQSEPRPQFVLGDNLFPVTPAEPITREFADNLSGELFALDQSSRQGYVQQWNLSLQHRFTRADVLELAYLGNQAIGLNTRFQANDCSRPDSLRCDPEAIRWPQFSQGVFVSASAGRSNYHALNVKYNHQFSGGFSVLGNYTFGNVIDSAGGIENGNQRGNRRAADRGPASFSRRHLFTVSALWELPFGRGRSVGDDLGPFLNGILGGWQVAAIGTFASGVPLTVTAPNRTPANVVNFRANRLCPGDVKVDTVDLREDPQYLDPACFEEPAAGFFGNAGTGIVTAPGDNNWDVSIGKDITTFEAVRLRFQADFFNAFNHTQFGAPVTNVAAGNFGQVTSAADARQIQVALRVLW